MLPKGFGRRALAALEELADRPGVQELAAMLSPAGPEIDDPVGTGDEIEAVLGKNVLTALEAIWR